MPAPSSAATPTNGDPSTVFKRALSAMQNSEVALAVGVGVILALLILPIPRLLLDFLLAVSITFSVLVLMTILLIRRPLEFSVFPTVLLIAAMMRLALNLASTRLILTDGHQGPDAAGQIIAAFGRFVMQGNVVIGIIVFTILAIVNFVVITKGSGRVAEVAARFALDAMPGKQMAIDADLSAGLIDEDGARKRREKLENESAFFGSMDGASKFVRGDAVAGVLITVINIVGGMLIGVAQNGLSLSEALNTYALLTIGDGLVSQIPALIVSTAAGLLVTKSADDESADKTMVNQFSGYPRALGMSAVAMGIMALTPGVPFMPFTLLAGLMGASAWSVTQRRRRAETLEVWKQRQSRENKKKEDPPVAETLKIDDLRIEIGYGLLPLIGGEGEDNRLAEQIKALRKQMAREYGFIAPPVRILDNMQLEADAYALRIREIECGRGKLLLNHSLAMSPHGGRPDLPGAHTREPAFGVEAVWIDSAHRDEALARGFTLVDPATVLTTHLTEIIRDNMADLLSYADVARLLETRSSDTAKLVEDLIPNHLSTSGLQRVLQGLLRERVSIRDLPLILEALAEYAPSCKDPVRLVESARSRLGRQLCAAHLDAEGRLPLIPLTVTWEKNFLGALIGEGEGRRLAMAPAMVQEFLSLLREALDAAARQGHAAAIVSGPSIRPFVRSIVERFRTRIPVLSQSELHSGVRIATVGQI